MKGLAAEGMNSFVTLVANGFAAAVLAAKGLALAVMSVVGAGVGVVMGAAVVKVFYGPGVKLCPVILKGCTFAAFIAGAGIIC